VPHARRAEPPIITHTRRRAAAGEGGFGKVYYGEWRGLAVAIKLLAPDACMRANVVEEFRREGVDDGALAERLQREGVEAFATSWHAMLSRIREKSAVPYSDLVE
jgi:hypothetical protein